jgi:TldD protein
MEDRRLTKRPARTLVVLGLALLVGGAVPLRAAVNLDQELRDDVVLRALVDELQRDHSGLTLEGFERPYFIEYALSDSTRAFVSAALGAITSRNEYRNRSLRTDVRVGSYELDNSNFRSGGFDWFGGSRSGAAMPIQEDYNAIRQAIWWATDRDYKNVVEALVQKKALMASKLIEDKPPDFSHEEPVVSLDERQPVKLDLDAMQTIATAVSAVFCDYPEVQDSSVTVNAGGGNRYLVNTEGTRLRVAGLRCALAVSAAVQADDGMKLSDSFLVFGDVLDDLPTTEAVIQRCRDMVAQLIALKNAPVLDSYSGPVLFDAQAAARVFARQFGSSFAGGQRPVGSHVGPDDFSNKLNKRVLPRFMTVVDDPSPEEIAGVPALGHYEYDDQGVPAQRVSLVEDGRLHTLLMSRNPSREFAHSNGHGRGFMGEPRAAVGCLTVTADKGLDRAELRQELLDAADDEGLEYGLRIASFGGVGDNAGRYAGEASSPLVMYKVYPDGHEELVRGAEIALIDLRAFKHIVAAGDTPYVYNAPAGGGQTYAVPALLFEELDLAKVDRDYDKPPILPSPLARAGEKVSEAAPARQ